MPSSEERSLFQIAWPAPPLGKGVVDSFPAVPFHQLILRNMPGMYSIYSFPHSRSYENLGDVTVCQSLMHSPDFIGAIAESIRFIHKGIRGLGANNQTVKEKWLRCLPLQDGLLLPDLPTFHSLAFPKVAHGSNPIVGIAFAPTFESGSSFVQLISFLKQFVFTGIKWRKFIYGWH